MSLHRIATFTAGSILFFFATGFAEEAKSSGVASSPPQPAALSDLAWADLRSEAAELQVLDERFQKLAAQAELTRQVFATKRAVWQQKLDAARTQAQVIAECMPDGVRKVWLRTDGTDGSCLKPPPEPKKDTPSK